MITLGIESSCDETSAALLDNGRIIKNAIYSQSEHSIYGGVVPEIASRAHLEKVDRLTEFVLRESGLAIDEVGLVAVTDSPGLAGALLVGISFALGLHVSRGLPLTGVNHLEGHICSVLLEYPDLQFPFLALLVSGGHTAIYEVRDFGEYRCLGQTVDDAAGEAFDKVGKLLGFAYPAGRQIEEEAARAQGPATVSFPIARISAGSLDFSFSGLKTAVKYFLAGKSPEFVHENRAAVCKAFQDTVVKSLTGNLSRAAKMTGLVRAALVGGVACNRALRESVLDAFGGNAFFPPPSLCTDNAAMIALAGFERSKRGTTRFPHMEPSRGI